MAWTPNHRRIRELTSKNVRDAIDTLVSYKTKDVLPKALAVWAFLLFCVFSLLLSIRIALTVPLF